MDEQRIYKCLLLLIFLLIQTAVLNQSFVGLPQDAKLGLDYSPVGLILSCIWLIANRSARKALCRRAFYLTFWLVWITCSYGYFWPLVVGQEIDRGSKGNWGRGYYGLGWWFREAKPIAANGRGTEVVDLLERFELDVAEMWFSWVDAVGPEVFVTEFGTLRCARVDSPACLERGRARGTVRLWTLRDLRLVHLEVRTSMSSSAIAFYVYELRTQLRLTTVFKE